MEALFQAVKYLVVQRLSKIQICYTFHYWLAKHPKIMNFSWKQGQNLGSSPFFLSLAVLSYFSLTFLLSHVSLPSICPRLLKSFTAVHNLILLSLSFVMALGCTLSIIYHAPNVEYIICYPKNTPPKGPLFFWAYVFYLSKIFEFMDTLLIIFSNSIRRLTFLHVYHHATAVIMCYISLHTSQSLFPGVLVVNSSVHVIMYYYYLMCAIGTRPK